ncbi:MAG: rRNA pseudouridine synthase [Anaerolineae bacterium]|nr:rRNA pseudouridine synthase [Anaerolineae bacterium]
MAKERLQKILAHAGYGSRRACEEIIEAGRVTVDGRIAHLGDKADPEGQRIAVDGVTLKKVLSKPYTYVMLNKPRGVISTVRDPQGRRTVRDLVPLQERLYPVGRLDADSEGLILMTDDGELTQRLTHPSYEHARVYRVAIKGVPTEETLRRWQKGIMLDGKQTRFDGVELETADHDRAWLRITIHEGRKHLVRRMVAALGHPATRLIRVAIGSLKLGNLGAGRWRHLRAYEIAALLKTCDLERR